MKIARFIIRRSFLLYTRVFSAFTMIITIGLNSASGQIINPKNLILPTDSMNRLTQIANALAKTNNLEVKMITVDTVFHPLDQAAAIVEFKDIKLSDDTFELPFLVLCNSNWPSIDALNNYTVPITDYSNYLARLGPASVEWFWNQKIYRNRKLLVNLDGEKILVGYPNALESKIVTENLRKFIEWVKTSTYAEFSDKLEYHHKLKDIDYVDYDKESNIWSVHFNDDKILNGYLFEIVNGKCVLRGRCGKPQS